LFLLKGPGFYYCCLLHLSHYTVAVAVEHESQDYTSFLARAAWVFELGSLLLADQGDVAELQQEL